MRVYFLLPRTKINISKGRWSRKDTSRTSKNASKYEEKGLKYVQKITDWLIRKTSSHGNRRSQNQNVHGVEQNVK
jgi:hypothetical protein